MFLSYLCQCLTLQKGHLADLTPPVFKSFSQFVCVYGLATATIWNGKRGCVPE